MRARYCWDRAASWARELATFAGPAGAFFSDGASLFSRWNTDGAR